MSEGLERYIGTYLISHRNHRTHHYVPPPFHRQPWTTPRPPSSYRQLPFTRLALHARGAPLISAANNRKHPPHTRIRHEHSPFSPPGGGRSGSGSENTLNLGMPSVESVIANADASSVASDESSGSAHSETCLPRIIKPRKRRKKDRKPAQNGTTEKAIGGGLAERSTSALRSNECAYRDTETIDEDDDSDDSSSLLEAISRCSPAICQCRYCDPRSALWDVSQEGALRRSWSEPCPGYSVESLRISDCDSVSAPNIVGSDAPDEPRNAVGVIGGGRTASEGRNNSDRPREVNRNVGLVSQVQLVPESFFKTFSTSSASGGTAAEAGMINLEVSSAIVTSLNGHRDLEIKFFPATSGPRDGEEGVATAVVVR